MRDYSLVFERPVDLEKVRLGDPLLVSGAAGFVPVKFIEGPYHEHDSVVETQNGELSLIRNDLLFEAPLAWVEDKPVYPGDTLYSTFDGTPFVIKAADKLTDPTLIAECGLRLSPAFLTRAKSETTREGWIAMDRLYGQGAPEEHADVRPRPHVFKTEADARKTYPDAIVVHVAW